jgi:serine/threonine protein phosphatase PrpC
MRVRFSALTDIGRRRSVNQDAYGNGQTGLGDLFIVCDGMGGHQAGEEASRLAVEAIVAASPATDPAELLQSAIKRANEQVFNAGFGAMGTTAVVGLFHANTLYVANVGDSRAYLVREGAIAQITRDHSLVAEQVAAGLLTAEQARTSQQRNIITRALGNRPDVEADIFSCALQAGDTLLLCSDGLHGLVSDSELAETISMSSLDEAAQRFIAQANARGGHDNITALLVQVDELEADCTSPAADLFAGGDAQPAAPVETAVPAPRTDDAERPLTRRGLLLAVMLLLGLIGLAAYVLLSGAPA